VPGTDWLAPARPAKEKDDAIRLPHIGVLCMRKTTINVNINLHINVFNFSDAFRLILRHLNVEVVKR